MITWLSGFRYVQAVEGKKRADLVDIPYFSQKSNHLAP